MECAAQNCQYTCDQQNRTCTAVAKGQGQFASASDCELGCPERNRCEPDPKNIYQTVCDEGKVCPACCKPNVTDSVACDKCIEEQCVGYECPVETFQCVKVTTNTTYAARF